MVNSKRWLLNDSFQSYEFDNALIRFSAKLTLNYNMVFEYAYRYISIFMIAPPQKFPKNNTSFEETPKVSFQHKQYPQIEPAQQNTNGKFYSLIRDCYFYLLGITE